MRKVVVFLSVLALLVIGCAQTGKKTGPSVKQEATATKQAEAKAEKGAKETGAPEEVAKETKPYATGEAETSACELKRFPNIHFDFDKYDLKPEARRILTEIAEYMKRCPDVILTIEGHCDERGSNEYNLALGWKRANEAKRFLVALGISPDRIITVSYGEERPLCFEHNEACWAKNRRDHFVFCRGRCLR